VSSAKSIEHGLTENMWAFTLREDFKPQSAIKLDDEDAAEKPKNI